MDGGVRRGSDVAKALALGAAGVFVGRPLLYALAAGGRNGACTWLRLLREDLVRTMVLLGARRVEELQETVA